MNDHIVTTDTFEIKIEIRLNGEKVWPTNEEMKEVLYFIKQIIDKRRRRDVVISIENAERIDRSRIGQGNRSALGQLVTEDSVFAPEGAKGVGDMFREKYGVDDGSNMELVEDKIRRKQFKTPITLADGKVVNI
jgi:hypothetical protein